MKSVNEPQEALPHGLNLVPIVELMMKKKQDLEASKLREEAVPVIEEEEEEGPKVKLTKEAIAVLVRSSEESERLPMWRKVIYTIGAFEVFYLVWHWLGMDFDSSENMMYAIICMAVLALIFLFRHVLLWLFFGVFTGRSLK